MHRSIRNYLESLESESESDISFSEEDHGQRKRRKRFALAVLLLNESLLKTSGQGPQVGATHICHIYELLYCNLCGGDRDRSIKRPQLSRGKTTALAYPRQNLRSDTVSPIMSQCSPSAAQQGYMLHSFIRQLHNYF